MIGVIMQKMNPRPFNSCTLPPLSATTTIYPLTQSGFEVRVRHSFQPTLLIPRAGVSDGGLGTLVEFSAVQGGYN